MSNRYCVNCYYDDLCQSNEVCKDYTPVNEQAVDECIEDIIEKNKIAFRSEWFQYIEEFNS